MADLNIFHFRRDPSGDRKRTSSGGVLLFLGANRPQQIMLSVRYDFQLSATRTAEHWLYFIMNVCRNGDYKDILTLDKSLLVTGRDLSGDRLPGRSDSSLRVAKSASGDKV